jgi:hypothetical protein
VEKKEETMRATLDQLKAMNPEQLSSLWQMSEFPFDMAQCGACLSMHKTMQYCKNTSESEHQALHRRIMEFGFPDGKFDRHIAAKNIEELYALRLFYDSLYPPAAEDMPSPSVALATEEARAKVVAK